MKHFRYLIVLCLLNVSLLANAQTELFYEDHSDYTTINGLDWLDLTATNGLSITEALTQNPGYRLPTSLEFSAMLNHFYSTANMTFDGEYVGYWQYGGRGHYFAEKGDAQFHSNTFYNLFGITTNSYIEGYDHLGSEGLFVLDSGTVTAGGVHTYDKWGNGTDKVEVWFEHCCEFYLIGLNGLQGYGVYLVRDANVVFSSILFLLLD